MIKKYLDKLEFNIIVEKISNNCHTFIGKNIASKLEPSTNSEKVLNMLSETSEACELIHLLGGFPLEFIDDMSLPLKKLESSIPLNAKFLLNMANVLKNSRELLEYYKSGQNLKSSNYENNKSSFDNNSSYLHNKNSIDSNNNEFTFLNRYFDKLYTNKNIEDKILFSIISEDEIADNASSKLASIRHNKKNLESQIKSKLNSIIHSASYSKYLMDSVVTIRNDRYVIPVKDEYKSFVKGFIHDVSSSGSTVYIEPVAIFEMNNTINNLTIDENREIDVILENLSSMLYPIFNNLKETINSIGMIDFIVSKAKYSIDHNCVMPKIDNFINFKNARHPLISKDSVVPTSIYLGVQNSINNHFELTNETTKPLIIDDNKKHFRTLVITGPNTGGKTVTLKTVGLLCAMAQAGLHIPVASGSSIKVFDNIFADIGDEQSIAESLSTFSSHITNIVQILDCFTENSLILVDELGSGTDPIEGSSLAISLIETFHKRGAFTVATTHYHEMKTYCISHEGFENASCEFDIKNMKPTYHLLIGIPGKSNAFAICRRIGINDEIIDRASSLISKPDTDIETLLKHIYDTKKDIEEKQAEIDKNLNQVENLRKSLESEHSNKLISEQEKVEKAKTEAREILINAKKEANSIISELSHTKDIKKANNLRNQLNNSIKESNSGSGLDLSVLLKLNNKDANRLDISNGKKGKSSNAQKSVSSSYIQNRKAMSISTEINLLGETVDVAVDILEKYLDNCKMAGLHKVRVVHGKGTGKLREGIHRYLKRSKYVKDFYIAPFGEGDYGVTIVELK